MAEKFDFGGYCTKHDIRCSDGRVIRSGAFKHNSGKTVPIVWNHGHNEVTNVLGHALLEYRPDGVYAYGSFNDTENGRLAKNLVEHGDIVALSIYANKLKQEGGNVLHGDIREVSLVLAGANPGAMIDLVMSHSDSDVDDDASYDEAHIALEIPLDIISHAEEETKEPVKEEKQVAEKQTNSETEIVEDLQHSEEETIQDVFNTLSEKQKTVVYAIIGELMEDKESNNGGEENVKHNVFDQDQATNNENVLSHSEFQAVMNDVKRYGNLKDSFLAHGIENIDYLFPEAVNLNKTPEFIQRDMGWVSKVMGSVHKSAFSRIKSVFADIREDEARAKGYLKGKLKKEEVFGLLKRTTSPTTIYKKQKFDRDDIVDITDFDVIAWIKAEMRMMLDEEIARAILIGDGRLASSDDKINEQNIRPVYNDEELYTVQAAVEVKAEMTPEERAKAFIKAVIKNRRHYKGSGNPTLYTTEELVSDCLLIEDANGRFIYDTMEKLKNVLRVKEIVTVPVMEGVKGKNGGDLLAVLVNLVDYNLGADKGGAINMFDDFDIDYNQQKYLIETRCSGALVKPFSAIAFEQEVSE